MDNGNAAGLNYIRIHIDASDFSSWGGSSLILALFFTKSNEILDTVYSLDDISGDISFASFGINNLPSYVFSVLQDIKSVNNYIKIHLVPWSPVCFVEISYVVNLISLSACLDER